MNRNACRTLVLCQLLFMGPFPSDFLERSFSTFIVFRNVVAPASRDFCFVYAQTRRFDPQTNTFYSIFENSPSPRVPKHSLRRSRFVGSSAFQVSRHCGLTKDTIWSLRSAYRGFIFSTAHLLHDCGCHC